MIAVPSACASYAETMAIVNSSYAETMAIVNSSYAETMAIVNSSYTEIEIFSLWNAYPVYIRLFI